MCCESSSLVKFSLIICRKVENSVISCRTFVCLDVSVGEIFEILFFLILKYSYILLQKLR